jgi:flavin reductase
MSRLGAAVNLITTHGAAGKRGLTASAVCSVTDMPPTILVCVNRSSATNAALRANGVLCLNILCADHQDIGERFADAGLGVPERFGDQENWIQLKTGSPVLKGALAALDCRIAQINEVGTHSVIFAEVIDVRLGENIEGLVYFYRHFHRLRAPSPLSPQDR